MIKFNDDERKQLLVFAFEQVAKRRQEALDRNIVGFWEVAPGITATLGGWHDGGRFFNLQFKCDVTDYEYSELGTWTVYAYNYDYKKPQPFATDEASKTLLFENVFLSSSDKRYTFLEE